MNARLPLWAYAAVAAGIAALAFVVGSTVPGMGVAVTAGGSVLWTAYSARRASKVGKNG